MRLACRCGSRVAVRHGSCWICDHWGQKFGFGWPNDSQHLAKVLCVFCPVRLPPSHWASFRSSYALHLWPKKYLRTKTLNARNIFVGILIKKIKKCFDRSKLEPKIWLLTVRSHDKHSRLATFGQSFGVFSVLCGFTLPIERVFALHIWPKETSPTKSLCDRFFWVVFWSKNALLKIDQNWNPKFGF